METALRRAATTGASMVRLTGNMFVFANFADVEKTHPLQGGFGRRKYRRDRRPGLPIEPIWSFYPKFVLEFVSKYARMARSWVRLETASRRIRKDPRRWLYSDQALTPVSEDETESLELFTHSDDARHAVEHARKVAHLTGSDQRATADAV